MDTKIVAMVEVAVLFGLTMFLIALVGPSSAAASVRQVTHRSFLEYIIMITVPLLALLALRRKPAIYGISFGNLRYHLDMALAGFPPVAAAGSANNFVDDTTSIGALFLMATWIAVLVLLGLVFRRKPMPRGTVAMAAMPLIWLASIPAPQATIGKAVSALGFYVFFVGLGEELLFRGYIQSHLNGAFGRPFTFFGVQWGWGAVIAALLFALMHFLNLGSLAKGHWLLMPWWGVWTFFAGVAFSFVREKTGSIVAPALLHGLPQGIAWAILGL